jgi:hypothetical protein
MVSNSSKNREAQSSFERPLVALMPVPEPVDRPNCLSRVGAGGRIIPTIDRERRPGYVARVI